MPDNIEMLLAAAGVGYLIGSLSFAIIVAAAKGVDIRTVGSGNPGATNVKRALGKGAGNIVFLLDFLKGLIPALWPMFFYDEGSGLLSVLGLTGAILGHNFPVYYGFKGGKGVATTMGGLLAIMPMVMLMGIVVWLIIFYTQRIVSVAAIAFGLVLPFAAWGLQSWLPEWFVNILGKSVTGRAELVFAILISVLISVRHRANIMRLLRGEELFFKKKD